MDDNNITLEELLLSLRKIRMNFRREHKRLAEAIEDENLNAVMFHLDMISDLLGICSNKNRTIH